jgi:hypothetical protein
MKTLPWTLTLLFLCSLALPAHAAQTSFAPVLLSPGETLVLSARVNETDWQPVEAGIVNPCLLVGFKILDLAGNVVASSPQAALVDPGEAVTFEVSHADVAQGILPEMFVGIVETEPIEQPVASNGKIMPRFSLQVADTSGVRIYAEKALAKVKPRRLSQRLSFAPVLLAPGESVNLAAFNGLLEKAGGVEPCFLVAL